jgi:hypothetical protein
MTEERLARLVACSEPWISDLEAGRVCPDRRTIIAIEQALKLIPKVLLDIFEFIKYEESGPVLASRRYAAAERRSRICRHYSALVVPDLLQTPEYARAAIVGSHPTARPRVVEALLSDRLKRQQILSGESPAILRLVVDETVLRRPVGGRDVHQVQLDSLIEAAQSPHIGIQVIPMCTGAHAGLTCSFTILSFEDEPNIAYTEDSERGYYQERPKAVRMWFETFEALCTVTLPAMASSEVIQNIRDEL